VQTDQKQSVNSSATASLKDKNVKYSMHAAVVVLVRQQQKTWREWMICEKNSHNSSPIDSFNMTSIKTLSLTAKVKYNFAF
jgi:hypothetical protein